MLRSKRWVAIACVSVILLAVCLVGQAAADGPLKVDEPAGGGALASIRLVIAVLLATAVAALVFAGLLRRAAPK